MLGAHIGLMALCVFGIDTSYHCQKERTTMFYTQITTSFCPITLVGDDTGLQRLYMHTNDEKYPLLLNSEWVENHAFFDEIILQLEEYFAGQRKAFTVKLNPQGSDYQKKAWYALTQIPYGEFRTYKDQATFCGNPNASRAVGSANGKNPIPVIIPCHRVIGSNGQLTGFAFGLDIKKKLLSLEASN